MSHLHSSVSRVVQRPGSYANIFTSKHATSATHSAASAVTFSSGAVPKFPASPEALQSKKSPVQLKAHRLVVVDDDAGFRESLCFLLKNKGYPAPVACAGGRELIKLLMETPFDLVLLDLLLPDVSGLEVLGMLRQSNLDVAVVVISGDSMIDSAIGALRLGADDYVRKPYVAEMLLHTIENVLRRRELEKSQRQMAIELERSERKYHFLVDASPDLIFTLDEQFNFSFVSERVTSLSGFNAEDLMRKPFLSIVYDEDLERTRYTLERVSQGACSTELRLISRDETACRDFEVSFVPVDLSPTQSFQGNGRRCKIYGVARDISVQKLNNDRLAFLAFHDALTGLPNRALYCDRLGLAIVQAKRNGMKVASMFVDLDRFKLANDTFGHQQGDELLKEAARRLQDSLRETDTLARIGGDEFTILLPGLRTREDAACVADKLVSDMAKPFLLAGIEVSLTASVGISMYPDDGEDIETLLRLADLAMYHVKSHGKNGAGFFSSAMGEQTSRRLLFENEIRHGLESREFELHYQRQVDSATQKVVGLEALSRWQHPSKGLLSASSFVPMVEEIGLMPALTYWVLQTACRDMRDWQDHGFDMPCMSVNISPYVLEQGDFHERMLGILHEHAIPHERFEIEITENVLVGDRQKVTDRLLRLSREGIRIAIDDFGTQYSSLSYLRYLPVNTLKIDQSFVREIERIDDNSPIIRAIVAIAEGLDLNVVAEGVETEVQARFLRKLGCRKMQGFLYGQPMPAEKIEALLEPL